MSDVALRIENVSKQYRLGKIGTGTFSHDLNRWWHTVRGKEDPYIKVGVVNDRSKKSGGDYVWALRDISFDLKQGEVLGIIGRNGAGKSTLLKILSRTTLPTNGSVKIKGRVASLLEVGTGFHPELTGRENIFLNGAILGMTKAEIKSKFDEIVDFSGVEKYIDTPVKRYSSGMYVRLAFAVAAHLEPEILIVDEVLAVGDAEFQKKALGKMKDVSVGSGRTVLFVSHNMAAISSLCSSGVVLKNGNLVFAKGLITDAIDEYSRGVEDLTQIKLRDRVDRQGEGYLRLVDFKVVDEHNQDLQNILSGQKIAFIIRYECSSIKHLTNIGIALSITRADGFLVTVLSNEISSAPFKIVDMNGYFSCQLNKTPLTSGLYSVNLIVRQNGIIQDWITDAVHLRVDDGDFYNTGRVIPNSHRSVLIEHTWIYTSLI